MGPVHMQVKLTNAIDEGLVRRGLLNPNRLRTYETVALVDADAVRTVLVTGDTVLIGQTVLETLDLLVDCNNQRLIPNPEHPDYPVLRV